MVGVASWRGTADPAPIFWAARGSYARRGRGAAPDGSQVFEFLWRTTPIGAADLSFSFSSPRIRPHGDSCETDRSISRQIPLLPMDAIRRRSDADLQAYLLSSCLGSLRVFPELEERCSTSARCQTTPSKSPMRLSPSRPLADPLARAGLGRPGFQHDQAVKAAVEAHAMDAAIGILEPA